MADFSQSRHGYSPAEVDSYINRLKLEYEDRLAAQKERIFDLVEELKSVKKELDDYHRKDDEISSALMNAVSKAKEIEAEAEARYESELNRLKIFHTKWVRYYNEIKERYPIDDGLMSVERFLLEMNRILGSEAEIVKTEPADEKFTVSRREFIDSYRSERERLKTGKDVGANESEKRFSELLTKYSDDTAASAPRSVEGFNPMEKIGKYIAGTASNKPQISDSGFDLNEVLNPGTKLDLGELCRELGLMEGDD